MQRSDLPYIVFTLVFAVAIFVAGRMSAPDAPVVREPAPAPPAAPSIVVITQRPEPPVALLPDIPAPEPEPTVAATAPASAPIVTKKQPLPVRSAPTKIDEVGTAQFETIFLEETPELPINPYKK